MEDNLVIKKNGQVWVVSHIGFREVIAFGATMEAALAAFKLNLPQNLGTLEFSRNS